MSRTSVGFGRLLRRVALVVSGATLLVASAGEAGAQAAGRLTGRVIDAESGRPVVGARLLVVGTTIGATSLAEGRYTVAGVPAGSHSVQVSALGYAVKTVTGVQVGAGTAAELDVTLSPAAVAIAGVTVSAAAERGSVSRALDEQRTAVGVVNAISSEQIARSPDRDAASAVQRVSGVTVQDGKYVFVRGLGERYTTASLNGVRLPSPEPEKRVVPLDLFPSALLQSVSTVKTFTPDLPGDFGGAQVNITTREFPARRRVTFSMSGGGNSAATAGEVLAGPAYGGEWFAFGAGGREAPAALASPEAVRGLTTDEATRAALQQLPFSVRPRIGTGRPNSSLGFSIGGRDPLFGREIGYIGSVTYSFAQEVRDNEVRANPIFRDGVEVLEEWRGSTGRTTATAGGILNLSTTFADNHRLSLNNSYTRTMDNEAHEDVGYTNYFQVPARRSTTRYVERSVRSNQLEGEHTLGGGHALEWRLSNASVTRSEPDRADLVYVQYPGASEAYWGLPVGDPEGMRRTFGNLRESNYLAGANYRLELGGTAEATLLRVGGLYRYTDRDATNFQFSVIPQSLPAGANQGSPEEIFALAASGEARFRIAGANEAGSYSAAEHLGAGYAMAEIPFGGRFRLIGGARVESANLRLDTDLVGGARSALRRNDVDVLPSLVLNTRLTDDQTLRVSATQTLARPEYRELSPFAYLEVIGGEITKGNSDLRRSLIRNFDARWEMYPSSSEILSFGVFAKQFSGPIERVDVSTGGPPQVTFVNAEGAVNLGAEVELRRSLEALSPTLSPFGVFTNVTLMHSRIEVGEGVSANTNTERPMIGQAPYVVNAGLNYTGASSLSATLLYNVVGRRIWAAGSIPFPDIYEEPRQVLDLSLRFPTWGGATGSFDARNLLNSPSVLRQGPVERERYRSGRVFSFGVSLTPAS